MNEIIITAESTCDLSKEILERYNIKLVPLVVVLGEKSYFDGIEISAQEIFDYVDKTGQLPKTAATPIGTFTDFFKEIKKEADTIIHISISSHFSSASHNASIAANDFENVYVIDSLNLSTGIGLLAVEAAAKVQEGKMSAKEIVAYITSLIPKVDASFVLENLEYLRKGGRCSTVTALGANLLKIKPCIEVKNGKMSVGKKYRGTMKEVIKKYTEDRLSDSKEQFRTDRVFVTTACPDDEFFIPALEAVKDIGYFDEVFVTKAGGVIASHCGSKTIGVLFIRK